MGQKVTKNQSSSIYVHRQKYPRRLYAAARLGTHCYPSPLDRVRVAHRVRVQLAAANRTQSASSKESPSRKELGRLEPKRSLPLLFAQDSIGKDAHSTKHQQEHEQQVCSLKKLECRGQHDVSFAPLSIKGDFTPLAQHANVDRSLSLNDSWALYNFLMKEKAESHCPNSLRNPNKAICTINARTTKILTANVTAAVLFAMTPQSLIDRQLNEFIKLKKRNIGGEQSVSESHLNADGNVEEVYGKLLDCVDAKGLRIPISVWIKRLESLGSQEAMDSSAKEMKCVVVMEPVERVTAQLLVNKDGFVLSCEPQCANIFELPNEQEMLSKPIDGFLQGINLNYASMKSKQSVTVRSSHSIPQAFPCVVILERVKAGDLFSKQSVARYLPAMAKETQLHFLTVWVFANISGQLTIDADGNIHSCHPTLARILFGHKAAELIGQSIKILVPNFFQPTIDSLTDALNDDESFAFYKEESASQRQPLVVDPDDLGENRFDVKATVEVGQMNKINTQHVKAKFTYDSCSSSELPIKQHNLMSNMPHHNMCEITDGCYNGLGMHRDGTQLDLLYQVRRVTLNNGNVKKCCNETLWILWISRNPETQPITAFSLSISSNLLSREVSREPTEWMNMESILPELIQTSLAQLECSSTIYDDTELSSNNQFQLSSARYETLYDTLMSIGKGMHGHVKLARQRTDNREKVVKFILKAKLADEDLVLNQFGQKIPHEADLLMKLQHPNILKVEAIFENDTFYQIIMPKHGDGMDLFEFIDRRPLLEEPVAAFMFRQLVDAVAYLHRRNIAHLDIKEEHILLDKNFNIKLIDFGSARSFENGILFATFCGSVEYCSPEVLLGEHYQGPELDVFSMGVTLYTLIFEENPFFDLEETLTGKLQPSKIVSSELMHLLRCMLNTDPKLRANIADVEKHAWTCQSVDISAYSFEAVFPNEDGRNNDSEVE